MNRTDNSTRGGAPRFAVFRTVGVFGRRKRNEKLNYMHMNPVKRGLVRNPRVSGFVLANPESENDWPWSSYRFYMKSGTVLLSVDIVE
jgi:hypothetical protein